ncbi:MAG: hypothetical protein IJW40_05630 [Clostridia bacterium]|nr:hypothetical protein [Clostridia bacterium]
MISDPICETPQYVEFVRFFEGFFAYIKKENAPIDFFSWHCYDSADSAAAMQRYLERRLAELGYAGLETQLNEWNNAPQLEHRGTSYAAAQAANMMIKMQRTNIDILCYYDARIAASMYGGLFNPMNHKPLCTYYAFKAFGELYALGNEVACESNDTKLLALAACDQEGDRQALMVVNLGEDTAFTCDFAAEHVYLIDAEHMMEEVSCDPAVLPIAKNRIP